MLILLFVSSKLPWTRTSRARCADDDGFDEADKENARSFGGGSGGGGAGSDAKEPPRARDAAAAAAARQQRDAARAACDARVRWLADRPSTAARLGVEDLEQRRRAARVRRRGMHFYS